MSANASKVAIFFRKATLTAAIEREQLEEHEKKILAVGLLWGREGAEKAVELFVFSNCRSQV